MIRTMMNGAVHFGGGIVLGVLTIFALKGMAEKGMTGRDDRMGMTGGAGRGMGGTGSAPPPDSTAGRGFDKAEGI
ncbi:hypothetical protein IGS68_25490 [Skermanella sp. TT6]|uniref:Uncharacterized protein n=1 Tax=Skermanella cutis TaxID=2775420 RepID=A0ABX7B5A2_9PROT|nr:hypothetical protein [Skermanella sp. TT6]QQP89303.1 hypothetical protein IGS68_25490 [Skermanella sp. TT6]